MAWNYAELSKTAKSLGGPEAFVQSLIMTGKKQMKPYIVVSAVAFFVGGIVVTKLVEFCVDKAEQAKRDEKEYIEKMVDYLNQEQKKESCESCSDSGNKTIQCGLCKEEVLKNV